MQSLQQLYRIGCGPSSSHTLAPRRAAERFKSAHPEAASYRVTLYGSLAATGRGHLTDLVITDTFAPAPVTIVWRPDIELNSHPNGLEFEALTTGGGVIGKQTFFSSGGGALLGDASDPVYPDHSLQTIMESCEKSGKTFWEYVQECESPRIWDHLRRVWRAMRRSVHRGLIAHGDLPGELGIPRKAGMFLRKARNFENEFRTEALLAAYAYAVTEENAAGEIVVTAPTCGSCGVLPAVLLLLVDLHPRNQMEILRALATAGLFGNVVKHNSSISGAIVGCQGEIGTACAMAAAAAAQLMGGTLRQIEYAAEMGLEHHLGLTCDPVAGLVQIPCIERNAHAASRSLSCARFALLSDGVHRISFDDAVAVMDETGRALPRMYKETSLGGLALAYKSRLKG
ncbi:MAG: L-serine ammonia-lyase, iron-sulfur-dependent, subunit alpha [Desulfovibrionales bacterium]